MATSSVNGSNALGRELAKDIKVKIVIKKEEVEGAAMDVLMEKLANEVAGLVQTIHEGCHTVEGREAVRLGRNTIVKVLQGLDLKESPVEEVSAEQDRGVNYHIRCPEDGEQVVHHSHIIRSMQVKCPVCGRAVNYYRRDTLGGSTWERGE